MFFRGFIKTEMFRAMLKRRIMLIISIRLRRVKPSKPIPRLTLKQSLTKGIILIMIWISAKLLTDGPVEI